MIDPALIDVVLPQHDGYPAHIQAADSRDTLIVPPLATLGRS